MLRGFASSLLLVYLSCQGALAVTAYRNMLPGVAHMGSKTCAACHMQIYRSYVSTGMGRSMASAREQDQLARVPEPITVAGQPPGRFFEVSRAGSQLFQSEYGKNADGSELFRVTRPLDYVVGSGLNGSTYLTSDGGFLYQAPLSYFTKVHRWGFSPGYEESDPGFNRPVLAGCITCHSGLPQTTAQANGRFGTPPFKELAIGCENCHGPGQIHVSERSRGRPINEPIDDSIVNPAKLPKRLAENICLRCHQGGDAVVLQPGKNYADFRPGSWLAETLAIFKVPVKQGQEKSSEILEHHSAMTLSKCFVASRGALTCSSCHNPHSTPAPERISAWYRSRCFQCHSETSCRLPLAARQHSSPADNCAGCHMPQRGLRQFAHSALTDHRIPARAGESYPESAYQQSSTDIPDLVYVDRPADNNASVPDVVLLQAYGSLAPRFPEYGPRYLALLTKLRQSDGRDPVLMAALGRYEMAQQTPQHDEQARQYFSRAITNGAADPQTCQALADVLARLNRLNEAVDVLRSGIDRAPWDETLYKYLAWRLVRAKRYGEAKQVIALSVQRFPQDDFMRNMLAQVKDAKE